MLKKRSKCFILFPPPHTPSGLAGRRDTAPKPRPGAHGPTSPSPWQTRHPLPCTSPTVPASSSTAHPANTLSLPQPCQSAPPSHVALPFTSSSRAQHATLLPPSQHHPPAP